MVEENAYDHSVIGSDRVEDTPVYGKDSTKIGNVRRIMIDKVGGQVRDVEVSIGGFLGMGGELHSLPWEKLKFDLELGGYKLDVTEEELRKAPTHSATDQDYSYDRAYRSRVYSYWAIPPYW